MTSPLDLLHEECIKVSNAAVVCEDGEIFTHKLVLASLSLFLKDLISDIPFGDEVTIFLKDFSKYSVNKLLTKSLRQIETKEEEALCNILFIPIEKKNEKTKLAWKEEVIKKQHSEVFEVKEETQMDDEYEKIELDKVDDEDDIDQETQDKIREFKREMIKNPVTLKHKRLNKRIEKKIRFEKAISAVKSGRFTNAWASAKIYGVCYKTLCEFLKEGRGFQGSGRSLKKFSQEEEKLIIDRVKRLVESGSKLTCKLLQRVIMEEAEIIMTNQPERAEDWVKTLEETNLQRFSYSFATRNKLKFYSKKLMTEKTQDSFDEGKTSDTIEEDSDSDAEKEENEKKIDDDVAKKEEICNGDIENSCIDDVDAHTSVQVQNVDTVDFEEFEEKIKNFEKEMIDNPVTPKDFKFNKKIDKKIRFEKAIFDVKSGREVSAWAASKVYGICHQTLSRMIKDGRGFTGPGSKLTSFTQEEEQFIVDRVKKSVENGSKLTNELLQKVMREEADIILINQPERAKDFSKILDKGKLMRFGYNFANRNNLALDVEKKTDIDERRRFECEVCYKKFTYKSGCVYHMRTSHKFLFSGT